MKLGDILRQPMTMLKSVEAQLPAQAPRISELGISVATALPAGPDLPAPPGAAGGVKLPRIEQIFKGPTVAAEEIRSTFQETVGGLIPTGPESPSPSPEITTEAPRPVKEEIVS